MEDLANFGFVLKNLREKLFEERLQWGSGIDCLIESLLPAPPTTDSVNAAVGEDGAELLQDKAVQCLSTSAGFLEMSFRTTSFESGKVL